MSKGIKICKVCGIEYQYCKTENRSNRFRYQDVSCCPEHGEIYFAQIMKSRSGKNSDDIITDKDADNSNNTVSNFDDLEEFDDDNEFEEDYNYEAEDTAI